VNTNRVTVGGRVFDNIDLWTLRER
jgi:hypothetical protein